MPFTDILMWLVAHSVLLVVAVFAMLVVVTYWPGRKARFQRDAMIPLRDDR
jgi:cbb3-type cytochrome oxidase subunit 3